jgi:hypothetical protein
MLSCSMMNLHDSINLQFSESDITMTDDYPWMRPTEPEETETGADVALRRVKAIAREHQQLRAILNKRACGEVAMTVLRGLAEQLRKNNPRLTKEQAFTLAYKAPENAVLRRAGRNASYDAIGYAREFAAVFAIEASRLARSDRDWH